MPLSLESRAHTLLRQLKQAINGRSKWKSFHNSSLSTTQHIATILKAKRVIQITQQHRHLSHNTWITDLYNPGMVAKMEHVPNVKKVCFKPNRSLWATLHCQSLCNNVQITVQSKLKLFCQHQEFLDTPRLIHFFLTFVVIYAVPLHWRLQKRNTLLLRALTHAAHTYTKKPHHSDTAHRRLV